MQIFGLGAILAAAFLSSPILGLLVLGIVVLVLGFGLESSEVHQDDA